jgi:hypothetical protein
MISQMRKKKDHMIAARGWSLRLQSACVSTFTQGNTPNSSQTGPPAAASGPCAPFYVWSAAARRRFGPRRLDVALIRVAWRRTFEALSALRLGQFTADQSGVKPPHSKVVTEKGK